MKIQIIKWKITQRQIWINRSNMMRLQIPSMFCLAFFFYLHDSTKYQLVQTLLRFNVFVTNNNRWMRKYPNVSSLRAEKRTPLSGSSKKKCANRVWTRKSICELRKQNEKNAETTKYGCRIWCARYSVCWQTMTEYVIIVDKNICRAIKQQRINGINRCRTRTGDLSFEMNIIVNTHTQLSFTCELWTHSIYIAYFIISQRPTGIVYRHNAHTYIYSYKFVHQILYWINTWNVFIV